MPQNFSAVNLFPKNICIFLQSYRKAIHPRRQKGAEIGAKLREKANQSLAGFDQIAINRSALSPAQYRRKSPSAASPTESCRKSPSPSSQTKSTTFHIKKLSKPIKLFTNAYHKIEANDLDFTLSYPLNDEMGKLCHALEKMKDCLSKNNETMFRQFAEQRRLNAAFSHDLRTPLTLLKGHATMLLSFIPKGLVSQEEILDEISVMSKNTSRLEKYVNAMTNLYRLEDIDIPRQPITFHSLIDNFNNTAEVLCYDKHFSITTISDNIILFINLDTVMQIYENLLSNSIRYAKSDIAISVVIENNNLVNVH